MADTVLTRRALLKTGAVASGALALPFVHGAHAAGKLSAFFWDHPVPSVPPAMKKLCEAWAAKEKVDLQVDFVSTNGDKILLTLASEGQARSGHDIATIPSWYVSGQAERLEPVDELIAPLVAQNGKLDPMAEYLGKFDGHWRALPVSTGSPTLPSCARIDLMKQHAGIDVTEMYPAGGPPNKALADNWNWETFLTAAEKCFKGGYPFGLPLGVTLDSVDWVGAMFASYGAELVDRNGNITVKSDPVKQVLEWFKRLGPSLPTEVYAWDNASNNKYLISGKGSLILNPPSAWAVAKRDAPDVAADCWTFPAPSGPKGRFIPTLSFFWGIYSFSKNKSAGKDLIEFLMQRDNVEARDIASDGYDLPPYAKLNDFKIWQEVGPPKGTVFNYPMRPASGQKPSLTGSEAAPEVAVQIYSRGVHNQMFARLRDGQTIPQVISWAQDEIDGYLR
jgi:ABC-type glycerol-3-phosphate transport system substrate-binding protein